MSRCRSVVVIAFVALASFSGSSAFAQGPGSQESLPPGQTNDPFPQPIVSTEGVITITLREFALLPDIDGRGTASQDEAPAARVPNVHVAG